MINALFLTLSFLTAFANATPCNDGWESPSSGSGTCSHHGGIAYNSYYPPQKDKFELFRELMQNVNSSDCFVESKTGLTNCTKGVKFGNFDGHFSFKEKPGSVVSASLGMVIPISTADSKERRQQAIRSILTFVIGEGYDYVSTTWLEPAGDLETPAQGAMVSFISKDGLSYTVSICNLLNNYIISLYPSP